MKLTKLEQQLLEAIWTCEFHDGRFPVDDTVWTNVATETLGNSAQGVITSCNKKGYTRSQAEGKDSVICITAEGAKALGKPTTEAEWVKSRTEHKPVLTGEAPSLAESCTPYAEGRPKVKNRIPPHFGQPPGYESSCPMHGRYKGDVVAPGTNCNRSSAACPKPVTPQVEALPGVSPLGLKPKEPPMRFFFTVYAHTAKELADLQSVLSRDPRYDFDEVDEAEEE